MVEVPPRLRLKAIFVRGIYGIVCALLAHYLSLAEAYQRALWGFAGSSAPYLTWTVAFVLYLPSVVLLRAVGIRGKFELFLRGITVYFSLFILTHVVIAS